MPTSAGASKSDRAGRLLETVDGQISELIALLSAGGEAALSLPCPGREKMGDGTVAACALHTANRYQLIAEFLKAAAQTPGAHAETNRGRHRIPRFLFVRGHGPSRHAHRDHDHDTHDGDYTAQNADLEGLLKRLSAARDAFGLLAELTDKRLDTVPPAGSFRFCDGQRTLEQVLTGLLKHQGHQIAAVKAAVA